MGEEPKKGIWRAIVSGLAIDWVKGGILALFPTAATALTAVSAYMADVPVWAIVTASMLTFASAATIIRAMVEVSWRIRVNGRLVCAGTNCIVHHGLNGRIDMIGLGLNLFNQSSRAIQYSVIEVTQIVDGRVCTASTADQLEPMTIQPSGGLQYRADLVPVTAKAGKSVPFTYRASVRYGEPGDMRYRAQFDFKGTYKFKSPNEVGLFEALIG